MALTYLPTLYLDEGLAQERLGERNKKCRLGGLWHISLGCLNNCGSIFSLALDQPDPGAAAVPIESRRAAPAGLCSGKAVIHASRFKHTPP